MMKSRPIVAAPAANVNELSGFPFGSKWQVLSLSPSTTPGIDPMNEFDFRAPTDDPDLMTTTQKQNYDVIWDCTIFKGITKRQRD